MEKGSIKENTEISLGKPHSVILFNDEVHSFEEVVYQVRKAIGDLDAAYSITMEAHKTGRAIVITAHKEKCEMIASVLEEIRLGVKIEQT